MKELENCIEIDDVESFAHVKDQAQELSQKLDDQEKIYKKLVEYCVKIAKQRDFQSKKLKKRVTEINIMKQIL